VTQRLQLVRTTVVLGFSASPCALPQRAGRPLQSQELDLIDLDDPHIDQGSACTSSSSDQRYCSATISSRMPWGSGRISSAAAKKS